jgi:hypothetical protein
VNWDANRYLCVSEGDEDANTYTVDGDAGHVTFGKCTERRLPYSAENKHPMEGVPPRVLEITKTPPVAVT